VHFGAYAPRTLDVGCGTGLLLDLGVTAPGMFTGIDPSQGMLNELIRKHPRVKDIQPALAEDVIDQYGRRSYELVVSLFGSASHLTGPTILRMAEITSSLMVIMTYIPPYVPDYYQGVYPPEYDESRQASEALEEAGGRSFTLNKFRVTVLGG
jgi:SAM-dependent methyltransferase